MFARLAFNTYRYINKITSFIIDIGLNLNHFEIY